MLDKLIELYYTKKWQIYLGCFILLIIWAMWTSLAPQLISVFRARSDIRQNNSRIKQTENWGTTVRYLKTENIKLKKILSEIQVQAPQDDELSYVLNFLSNSAEKNKVSFVSIKPMETVERSQYRSIPIHLEIKGSFHNLAKFLNLIESSKNVIKIEHLEIETKGFVSNILTVKILLKFLYLK